MKCPSYAEELLESLKSFKGIEIIGVACVGCKVDCMYAVNRDWKWDLNKVAICLSSEGQ